MVTQTKDSTGAQANRTVLALLGLAVALVISGLLLAWVGGAFESTFQSIANTFLDAQGNLNRGAAPGLIVWYEDSSTWLTYGAWVVLVGFGAVALFVPKALPFRTTESSKSLNVLLGLIAGGVLGGFTGFLWATFNPVTILPPYIHLRLFAFLIPLWGILFGRGVGFISGYVASVVWAILAGAAFVPPHTLIMDGIMVGLLTGWLPAVIMRRGMTREQLLTHVENNRLLFYFKMAAIGLIGGLVMSFFVGASLHVFTPLSAWASFFAIGVLSDTLPIVIVTGPLTEVMLRLTKRITWLPDF